MTTSEGTEPLSMPHSPRVRRPVVVMISIAVLAAFIGAVFGYQWASRAPMVSGPTLPASIDLTELRFLRLSHPDRTEVTDPHGFLLATFTDGARTVSITGPRRTFAEPTYTSAVVESTVWVRFTPVQWSAGAEHEPWFGSWFSAAFVDPSPDVLQLATEYFDGAADTYDGHRTRIAGNASFGPELDNGKREIGADFYDYLGTAWTFPDGSVRMPDERHRGALDCSGFLRMVIGYRAGYPLQPGDTDEHALPRRADSMARNGPGVLIIENQGVRPADLSGLAPGDLLFFTTDEEPDLDHSAIFLGVDSFGEHRFVSSRATVNGPTMGDVGGSSVLEGGGFYAERFRTARRI